MTKEDRIALRQAATVIANEAKNLAKRIAKFNTVNGVVTALAAAKQVVKNVQSTKEQLATARAEIEQLKIQRAALTKLITDDIIL